MDNIVKGDLPEWEKEKFAKFRDKIFIDDSAGRSILELCTEARHAVKKHGLKCIFVDYLQLVTTGDGKDDSITREQEISYISRSLKGLAKDLDIPVIAFAQLSRNTENRSQYRLPQLSDLRESVEIEQNADAVCFIHHPEQYKILEDAQGNDLRGKAEIILAKHRNGLTGAIYLVFNSDLVRFENIK